MRILGSGLIAALLLGCGAGAGTGPALDSSPPLNASLVEQLLLRADDARRLAFDPAGAPPDLAGSFSGAALATLSRQSAEAQRRGERRQERPGRRRLVHWSASSGPAEGVLEVRADQRLTGPGLGELPWTHTVRQWWARLAPSAAGWRISEDRDLPPERWWRI